MATPFPEKITDDALALAQLLLQFGRTNRITYHEDGTTPESDTDHTVMLGVMACAFAARFAPHLDLGKIAQFAFVHDLVEVYAGDTPTFQVMTQEDEQSKEEREHEALKRIKQEFGESFPWIGDTIETYERLDTSEARFVKTFDKILPKITHILNDGVCVREIGHTKEKTQEFLEHQCQKLFASYGADQPEAMALLKEVNARMDSIRYE